MFRGAGSLNVDLDFESKGIGKTIRTWGHTSLDFVRNVILHGRTDKRVVIDLRQR